MTQYLVYRRLGVTQGWSGRVQKILLPPEFDPGIFQPVASRYIDSGTSVGIRGVMCRV